MRSASIAGIVTALALAGPAWADTHLAYVDDAGQAATQVYVKDGKVRLETGGGVMLYDAAAERFTMIDTEERSYTVMGAEEMERMAAGAARAREQMAGSMARMREQLAGMPPEQRAMMEQMMGGLAAAEPAAAQGPSPVEIRPLGSTRKVAGHPCKDVQMVAGGRPMARMCVAELESLGVPAADRAALEKMHKGIRRMAAMAPGGGAVPDIMPQGLALAYTPEAAAADDGGAPETLRSISHGAVKADLFAVPEGYTEEAIPDMDGG